MFGGLFSTSVKTLHPDWKELSEIEDLETIKEASFKKTQVLFKHSTRCSISSMAYNRLEKNWDQKSDAAYFHYLDLIKYRNISDQIADIFSVIHQSPQMLVIKNGKCENSGSHNQVDVNLVS